MQDLSSSKNEDYEADYWKDRHFEDKTYWMVTQYAEKIKPKKVIDYGCGPGYYVHVLSYLGIMAVGYDISRHAVKHAYGLSRGKLSNRIPAETFDLVLCMDVLEHVNPKDEEGVINDLCKLSSKYILLSICDTTLSKVYIDETHINIRPRKYWEYQFNKRGWNKVEVPSNWLFKEQLYLFKKEVK